MRHVAAGVLGFLVGYVFDLVSLRPLRGARALLWLVHVVLIPYSLLGLALSPRRFSFPTKVKLAGWALLVAASAFEIHCLFFNLPFRRTYLHDPEKRALITTGHYALVRHPGVLWFFFVVVGLFMAFGSRPFLLTMPLWLSLDVLWVLIQERFVFTRIFEGYSEYQLTTPMLIPTAKSVRAFVAGLRPLRKEPTGA